MVKSAKIICFGTFCIIPVQMVKSAKNTCFSQICIFLCQNYMFWHFSDSFITLFSFLQIPMCIVLPSEQKTRSGTKYTGYVHKLIPEDEEKTSDFFQIILAYNGSTHYVPCLLETHRDLQQSLTNIESCIQGALHDVISVRELLPDGELKDFISDMQHNLKEMHLKLRHVDANSGTIMPMKRVKVQASEQPKKKPKSTASDASGSSVIQSPKKRVPGFVDPETNTYSDNITLPGNQCHCGERFTTIDEVKEHKNEKHVHGVYICFFCKKKMSDSRICWKHVHCVHLKLYIHRCSYKDKEDPTQTCAYGTDELGNAQSHMAREHNYDSPLMCPKCKKVMSSKKALHKHLLICGKSIGEKKSFLCHAKKCDKKYVSEGGLTAHEATHTASDFEDDESTTSTSKHKNKKKTKK